MYLLFLTNHNRCLLLNIPMLIGQDVYEKNTDIYLRGAKVALIGYDISNSESFDKAVYWVQRTRELGTPDLVRVLVACKCDLEDRRAIAADKAEAFAAQHGCLHVQTSAEADLNVAQPFIAGSRRWLDQHKSGTR